MKPLLRFLPPLLLLALAVAARADDPPAPAPTPSAKETLRHAIEPVVDAFSRSPDGPNRALSARVRIAESTHQPPELIGRTLVFRAEAAPADKVLFQMAALGTVLTVCRQGQSVWISPASRIAPLLAKVATAPPTEADRKPLAPLRLTVPTALFWVAFYFVPVHDAGAGALDGVPCRLLDLDPPEGGKATADKYMRVSVRTDRGQIARVEWRDHGDHGALAVEEYRLAPALPDGDFQPTAAQRADLVEVPIERFRPLMKLIGEEEDKRRKEQRERHP